MLYKEHLFQTFQALRFVKNLPPPNLDQLRVKRKYLPKRPGYENFKTLVLDLDETLVHCSDDLSNNPDVILPIKFPTGETIQAGMNIRPHALECLKAANENYEVVIFTASH